MHHSTKFALVSMISAAIACGGAVEPSDAPPLADVGVEPAQGPPLGPHGQPEEHAMLGKHAPRDAAGPNRTASPLLTSHGGAIMTSTVVQAIFWGTKWSGATFASDKIDGLDSFYAGVGGTPYANTNTEYKGTNGTVGTAVSYQGHVIDTTAAPTRAPSTSAILAEVCKRIATPVANGYYPVYTDTPRGSAGYCAWHSYGSCGGIPVQTGFFFSLDGDSGCDPKDTSGKHSQGLAALANVSGHELSEMVTDPRNGGWYDSAGSENSDKCGWRFDVPLVTFTNGSQWKIQGNWSNAAFAAGTGFPNASGQKACLFEVPFPPPPPAP